MHPDCLRRYVNRLCEFITAGVFATVGIWSASPATAQQTAKIHRVAFVNVGPAAALQAEVAEFRAGMQALGYIENQNLLIDFRWADGRAQRLPELVSEVLRLKPEVIVSTGGPPTILAVKAATQSVPVVFITGDPVEEGVVSNLSHPGGNLTGLSVLGENLDPKRLEFLKIALPRAVRIATVFNPASPTSKKRLAEANEAARRLGLEIVPWPARDSGELDVAFAAISNARVDALMVLGDPVLGFERARIVDFARRSRLPGIYFWREFVIAGGLMSYGTNLPATFRRMANYVDKILKGDKPGDLPVEQPTAFELVVNLKTAKELGLTIPRSLLLSAEIVE